jgi:hypothetical protein
MPEPTYKKPKEKIGTDEIFDLVFKAPSVKYGLQEFTNDILNKINAFEKEPGKIYIHCLKRDKDILVYDKDKKRTAPEEVIRQLWLIKLTQEYK